MSPSEVRAQSTERIVEMLIGLKPNDEAIAWLASVISSPVVVAGVNELAFRYSGSQAASRGLVGRQPSATTIKLDRQAFKAFFYRRRIPMSEVGPLFNRCSGWASAICNRGTIGFYAADELAGELGMHVDEFLSQVCAPEELARLSA